MLSMRKKHSFPIFLFLWWGLLLFAWVGATAQQAPAMSVTGAVLNEKGDALEGVTVVAENTASHERFSVMTDGKGLFAFNRLVGNEKYDFTFSSIGYEANSFKGFVVNQQGRKNTLLIRMREKKSELNEVVVTALGVRKE